MSWKLKIRTEGRTKINVFLVSPFFTHNVAVAVTISAIIKYINENNSIFISEGRDEREQNRTVKKKIQFHTQSIISPTKRQLIPKCHFRFDSAKTPIESFIHSE